MNMNKVRNRFVLYAMLSVFALLTVLLSIINGVNFTMAGNDADMLTQMISDRHGAFSDREDRGQKKKNADHATSDNAQPAFEGKFGEPHGIGPMGPSSPDMNSSLRYFTYAFDKKGNSEKISFKLSAVTEEEAEAWAKTLSSSAVDSTGWTRGTYRYRVYKEGKRTYITVIDQGRELLPSYRILIISIFGEIMGLLISFFVLMTVAKMLFKPLEEADMKQKSFIRKIENDFKLPLTVINASTQVIESENGSSDYTKAINRQVKKMTDLVRDIGSLAIFEENNEAVTKVNLSSTLSYVLDSNKDNFKERNIELETEIEDDVIIDAEDEAIKKMVSELVTNSLRYSLSRASFTLAHEGDRVLLVQSNDTGLPSGPADQVFDRFTVLSNAEGKDTVGLGLSNVKDIVKAHNGRVSAKVGEGMFTLTIAL